MPQRSRSLLTLQTLEITAVVMAALAGVITIVARDDTDFRMSVLLLTPTLEASVPLIARAVWPRQLHTARVVAALLVAFWVAEASGLDIDVFPYLPTLAVLIVVLVWSNRVRFRSRRRTT